MSSLTSSKNAPAIFNMPTRLVAPEIERLRSELDALTRRNGDVIMDLGRTEAIDGSGVGAIVYVCKRLAARGFRLMVRNTHGQPDALLAAAGLLRVLGTEGGERSVASQPERLHQRAQSA